MHVDLSDLDPAAKRFLAATSISAGEGAISIAERRRSFSILMRFSRLPAVAVESESIRLASCGSSIVIRIYRPTLAFPTLPGLIYFHGGGLVAGSVETHDGLCRFISDRARCCVLSVDYRLAPEHPFPAAIIDALRAVRWIYRNLAVLKIQPGRLAACGDSAGANLAVVATQILAERQWIKSLILLCPLLDWSGSHQSRELFAAGFLLNETTLKSDFAYYTGHRPASDPRMSPLNAINLDRLPAAVIHTAGYDPLRDEAAAFAQKLDTAGVAVRLVCHKSLIHHFYALDAVIPAARAALEDICGDIKAAFAC